MKHKWINILLNVSRIIFGLTFLFSGFVKAVDPMGSAYKFIDYFREFGLTFFNPFAVPLAVILAALEFTIGASILFGVFRRAATTAGLLFMSFFTPLTLYLAIANPVKDCGCFGDALILTNWETFYKNILLLGMALFLFIKREELQPLFKKPLRWIIALYAFVFSVAISEFGLSRLPILDFRPFRKGTNIPEAMKGSESEATYILVYEKAGKQAEFTLDNYPAEDSTWTFVETRTVLPKGAKEAAIKDFFLTTDDGEDVTASILSDPGYTFLLISPDWATADDNYIDRINELYDFARDHGYPFYGVSVNDKQKETEWIEGTGAEYPFLYSDATILETVIRPNPGMVLLKEGTIVWKKNTAHLPDISELTLQLETVSQEGVKKSNDQMIILFIVLLFFGPILVLLCFEKTILFFHRKRIK
ncbi:MAG: DoxX family membrane protein [Bacteroidales bacterium]